MEYLSYILFRSIVFLFWLLPFRLIYILSDLLAFLLHHVFKYRYEVVLTNLEYAFPEKNKSDIKEIAKKSYSNLSDIIVESIKGFSTDPKEIYKRYPIPYPEFMASFYKDNRDTVCFAAHYGNWEWATYCTPIGMPFIPIGLIKEVKNKYINNYTNRKRSRTGTKVVSIHNSDKTIISKVTDPKMMVYIADQNATDTDKSILVNFLGRPTYCLHGAEAIASNNNWPVFYGKVERISRGKYAIEIILISDQPSRSEPGEITKACFKILESQIRANPENWLWTHKRWKRNNIY